MAVQRLVRCDQGHVFDAGAGAACPQCGWPVPEHAADPARGESEGDARPARRNGRALAALLAVALVAAGALWHLRDSGGTTGAVADGDATADGAVRADAGPGAGPAEANAAPPVTGPDRPAGADVATGPAASGDRPTGADGAPTAPDDTGHPAIAEDVVSEPAGDGARAGQTADAAEPAPAAASDAPRLEAAAPGEADIPPAPVGTGADAGHGPATASAAPALLSDPALPDTSPDDRPTPPDPRQPGADEPGLATLLAVAPERLAAAHRALATPPPDERSATCATQSPHAGDERALGLSRALCHALALSRAERSAARGDVAGARAMFAELAADTTVAAGAPNARALFGLGVLLWRSTLAADRAEGARLLRAAAERGGLTGAVDLLMSDRELLEVAGIGPDALRPILETAYLQSPARFAARLAVRDIDTAALGNTAAALRAAARAGNARDFARHHGAAAGRQAPVLESLLAVTLEGDTKLRETPRAAERRLVAALISGLAGVTDGRVALALIVERGQADVAAHLPEAALWLVLALADLDTHHPQRPQIERLLRDWAGRLPAADAVRVAAIAGDLGVR